MRNTKSKIILVMCIAICFMVVGYAAFSTSLSITGTSNITSTWNVVFTKIEEVSKTSGVTIVSTPTASGTSATFNVGLTLPGDKIVYRITIENKGTIDAKVQNIVASATDSPAIIYSMSGIKIGDEIKKQETKTIEVAIEYDINVTSQPEKTSKTLTLNLIMIQSTGTNITPSDPIIDQPLLSLLKTKILTDNTAYADNVASPYVTSNTGIDLSKISSDTNGKGLYYTSTNTENNQRTYYYRGDVNNNFVQFGKNSNGNDMYWRIIRINEDGSIRLIYNGTSPTVTGADATTGNSIFNANKGNNIDVGYMYGLALTSELTNPICVGYDSTNNVAVDKTSSYSNEVTCESNGGVWAKTAHEATHANIVDSVMKDYIDDWYENNLINYSNYLADAGFCNDRSVAPSAGLWNSSDTALGYGKNYTVYGSYGRLMDLNNSVVEGYAKPQYKCPNESNDLFTTKNSTKGNKSLKYPIGLITADEMNYSGGTYGLVNKNENYYLYINLAFYTITPNVYNGSVGVISRMHAMGGSINSVGSIVSTPVRPVINLKSNVQLVQQLPSGCTTQDGTASCPYVIKTN